MISFFCIGRTIAEKHNYGVLYSQCDTFDRGYGKVWLIAGDEGSGQL